MKAYVNILKLQINTALRRRSLSNYPMVAIIEPTLFCNLRCPGCITGLRLGLRPPSAITWELYKCIIDEIGDYLFELLMHNWGEPLLHKQTPDFIKYAKSKEMRVLLSTNLSNSLSDAYIRNLVTSGLDQLIVSLDGASEDTYNKYRRGGDFSLVRENMLRIQSAKRALDSNTPAIVWQFLVFRHNEHEIETAQINYRNWGADILWVGGALVPQESDDEGFQPSTIPQYNFYSQKHPYQVKLKLVRGTNRPCSWLYRVFVLNPNGSVSPCCGCQDENDDFAHYSPSRGFFDAWNSHRFKMARSLFSKSQKPLNSDAVSNMRQQSSTVGGEGIEEEFEASLSEKRLICQFCPMPWNQDFAEGSIASAAFYSAVLFLRNKEIRYLIAMLFLLLIGGVPLWKRMVLLIRSKVFKIGSILKSLIVRPFSDSVNERVG